MQKNNCINCGAPLCNDGEIIKCAYCGTEYNCDKRGYIEDYKVKLNIRGQEREFYVSNITAEYICDGYRNVIGDLSINYSKPKLKMDLIEM